MYNSYDLTNCMCTLMCTNQRNDFMGHNNYEFGYWQLFGSKVVA